VKSVKLADQEWQQRGLLDRLMQAETRNEKLAVINSELQYLQTIVRRNQLYPNQQRYAEKLIQIYNTLTGAKK
jgi:predicted component of type VI protein secretion system